MSIYFMSINGRNFTSWRLVKTFNNTELKNALNSHPKVRRKSLKASHAQKLLQKLSLLSAKVIFKHAHYLRTSNKQT